MTSKSPVRRVLIGLVAAVAVAVGSYTLMNLSAPAHAEVAGVTKGQAAPDFTIKTIDDKVAKLSELKGKVVLIDFWATWCGPCVRSLPHVNDIAADKALADKGLTVLAINLEEGKDDVKKFLDAKKLTLTVGLDSDGKVAKDYGITAIPCSVVIGRDGNVAAVFIGMNEKGLSEAIGAALAAK